MMNSDLYARMKEHLYSKKPVLGADSPFSELLQTMVNTILDGEMDSFLTDEDLKGKSNKRNGKRVKKVRSSTGDNKIQSSLGISNSSYQATLFVLNAQSKVMA